VAQLVQEDQDEQAGDTDQDVDATASRLSRALLLAA
jgi:hypothetical protein